MGYKRAQLWPPLQVSFISGFRFPTFAFMDSCSQVNSQQFIKLLTRKTAIFSLNHKNALY